MTNNNSNSALIVFHLCFMSAEYDLKRKYETQLQLNERMAREFDNLKVENNEQKISKMS